MSSPPLNTDLNDWIKELAAVFDEDKDPLPKHYYHFVDEPTLAISVIKLLDAMEESQIDDDSSYYSACLYALDVSVAQLQALSECGNKLAVKTLDEMMSVLAQAITHHKHTLSFWLPLLNAFYEVNVALSEELKDAYLDLASDDEEFMPAEEISHLDAIRDVIQELSPLSTFDIAENFFAQSYAMPAEFFNDLILDLYSIEEGADTALLTLLHPNQEVRDLVVSVHDQLIHQITISPISLSRLQSIKHWYPLSYHERFDEWIKIQRKKGVVFPKK